MGRQFRQLRAAVEIPLLRDLSADEPALHLHGGLAARARALLPARRYACGGRLVPAGRARARGFEAVLLGLKRRPRRADWTIRRCRRADRVGSKFAALHMSAHVTLRPLTSPH